MNRLTKLPPSRRKAADDWKVLVADAAKNLVLQHVGYRPLEGQTKQRATIINQLRIALDEQVQSKDLTFRSDGGAMIGVPEVFRLMLQRSGFDWRSPTAAESVMLVAQRAIDAELTSMAGANRDEKLHPKTGRPWTWQDRIEYVVRMILAIEQDGTPKDLRAKVWDNFERAMGSESSSEWTKTLLVAREDGQGAEPEECVETPALFRMVLWTDDVDWYQPGNRARVEDVIRATLDAELT